MISGGSEPSADPVEQGDPGPLDLQGSHDHGAGDDEPRQRRILRGGQLDLGVAHRQRGVVRGGHAMREMDGECGYYLRVG